MKKPIHKPTPEAKALSLFLQAFKSKDNKYKEELKHINRQWDLFLAGELDQQDYMRAVLHMLETYGGYEMVLEQTVKHYIDTTGSWIGKGDDQYQQDAQAVAERLLKA
jgi:hypothetical protein